MSAERNPLLSPQDITKDMVRRTEVELARTKAAYESACENLAWLTEMLDCYQSYLDNVRGQVRN